MRAQAALPTLAVALLLVTGATTVGLAVANGALADARREPVERQAAIALSERLVAESSPLTVRRNVLSAERARSVNATTLRDHLGLAPGTAVSIRLGEETILAGDVGADARTVQRIVVRQTTQERTIRPDLTRRRSVTLPRRGGTVSIDLAPPGGRTVTRVLANERIALRNPAGLSGQYRVGLSRFETTTLRFRATGPLPPGSVALSYAPTQTRKTRLEVRLDG